jgi:hypothetical protein
VVSGSGDTWTVAPNQLPGVSNVAVNTIGVDGFQLRDGFHGGNYAENVVVQAACNVSLRNALITGANQFAPYFANTTTYASLHATPASCGNLEVSNNNLGDATANNLANPQTFGIMLDPGSLSNYYVNNVNRVGRVIIQGNMLQGNRVGSIVDNSAPPPPQKSIANNLQ